MTLLPSFSCLVIGEEVEEQINLYLEEPKDKTLLEFFDAKTELRKDYETYIIPDTHYTRLKTPFGAGKTLKEYYKNFNKALVDWYLIGVDKEKNAYGYWHNPHAKLSSYVIGGKYSSWFKSCGNLCSLKKEHIDLNKLSVTEAVIKDKIWRGISGLENISKSDREAWQREFFQIIKDTPENTQMTIIECRLF